MELQSFLRRWPRLLICWFVAVSVAERTPGISKLATQLFGGSELPGGSQA
jgi:hypothetical protein